MARITLKASVTVRPWARALVAVAMMAPWAFAWIGAERLAAFVAKHGMRVSING